MEQAIIPNAIIAGKEYIQQMLFLGWNVGLASDVFLLESGCVGFLASSFMCHSFYTANIINKLHPHSA